MRKFYSFVLLGFLTSLLTAQEINYAVSAIDDSLLVNANAVIRNEEIKIEVISVDKMIIKKSRTVTVLNEIGEDLVWAGEIYDEDSKVKKQHAIIFDSFGKEIRRFKKSDFQDRSYITQGTLISDARISYIDYSPKDYPYTIQYESEVREGSTIFLRDWMPVKSYSMSVERSSYILKNPSQIPIRFLEKNFYSKNIYRNNSEFEIEYEITNLPAYRFEKFSPDLKNFVPWVKVALNQFSLVGVVGEAANWKELGKWQYDNLLKNKLELPESTKNEVANLTSKSSDIREKIQMIYNYVQENTRYVSVQLGIGGWEPMSAMEVDQVKYGDCKALTNYTRALLNSQNIPSNYAVVYGGNQMKDIDENFASMEGNHVILQVPLENENIWLECTSQSTPINYIAGFTDNRKVLIISQEGGEIVKTKEYGVDNNLRETKAVINIDEIGGFKAQLGRESFGTQYGKIYQIESFDEDEKDLYYKEEFAHLRDLQVEEMNHVNDRRTPKFSETLYLKGERYATKIGNSFILPLEFTKLPILDLPRSSDRKLPFELERGMNIHDQFAFFLPIKAPIETLPENVDLKNEYGFFQIEVSFEDKGEVLAIIVNRNFKLNSGLWPADKYKEFRDFINEVKSKCNPKIVIDNIN